MILDYTDCPERLIFALVSFFIFGVFIGMKINKN